MVEPLNATFHAFRKREKGGVLLKAAITFTVLLVVLYVCVAGAVWAIFGLGGNLAELQSDPEALQRMMSPGNVGLMILVYLIFLFSLFVLLAAFEAACLRWMVRGETKGLFGLALDEDTWRVYGIYWIWFLAFVFGAIAMAIVVGFLGAWIGGSPAILALPLLIIVVPIVLGVRLAPAAATAIAEQKFAFFDAWKVSSDRFWALFGSYFLLCLIYFLLASMISGGWMAWAFGPHLADMMAASGDPVAMSEAITQAQSAVLGAPGGLAIYIGVQIVMFVIGTTYYVALFGVNARAASAALEEAKIERESAG
jgi:hypothetical protein